MLRRQQLGQLLLYVDGELVDGLNAIELGVLCGLRMQWAVRRHQLRADNTGNDLCFLAAEKNTFEVSSEFITFK